LIDTGVMFAQIGEKLKKFGYRVNFHVQFGDHKLRYKSMVVMWNAVAKLSKYQLYLLEYPSGFSKTPV